MDQENIDYLYGIARKVTFYYNTRKKAISYLLKHKVTDKDLSVNVLLMAAIWAAHKLNEDITEENLLMNFGLTAKEDAELSNEVMRLHPDQHHLSLQEILDITVERSGKST
jgi:hypothetical protein